MTLVRRRTEITVETHEVLVVRAPGARPLCDACGGPARPPDVHASGGGRVRRLCAALRAWLLSPRAGSRGQTRPSELA